MKLQMVICFLGATLSDDSCIEETAGGCSCYRKLQNPTNRDDWEKIKVHFIVTKFTAGFSQDKRWMKP